MRLIGNIQDPKEAQRFSDFLTKEGIENQIELIHDSDWNSEKYGDKEVRLWVYDEDQYSKAMDFLEEFYKNPQDPKFDTSRILLTPNLIIEDKAESTGVLTLYFLFSCILLFAASIMTLPQIEHVALPYPGTAIYSSEITRGLLFDFPKAYEYLGKIVDTYGIKGLKNPETLPPEGKHLLQQYLQTPYWQGYYDKVVNYLTHKPPEAWETQSIWFEKIREGEVWRLFSPCLLHVDIFHLLFNMIWLVVLGKQMEQRLGGLKYLLFILLAGVVSNIAQYLMSGPNFIGFSGILTAMFGFIWMRQKRAAWEGYQLNRTTTILLTIFIAAMLLIQVASFFAEVYASSTVIPSIANTAHLVGVAVGLILGRLNFFAWKNA